MALKRCCSFINPWQCSEGGMANCRWLCNARYQLSCGSSAVSDLHETKREVVGAK